MYPITCDGANPLHMSSQHMRNTTVCRVMEQFFTVNTLIGNFAYRHCLPCLHYSLSRSLVHRIPLEHWNTGPLEHWNTGPLEQWNTGPLEHWNTGPFEHWNTGPLEHWSDGTLHFEYLLLK